MGMGQGPKNEMDGRKDNWVRNQTHVLSLFADPGDHFIMCV